MAKSTKQDIDHSYLGLFWTFLKIGSTAFGGFMALISVVQNYVVDNKKLISHEDMLDGISLATILPGPVAVNVVAYAGYRIRGVMGAVVCAGAVILPSFLLLLALSYMYFAWGEIPAVTNLFKGFLPAVAAIIVAAAYNMGKKTLNTITEYIIALTAMAILIFIGGFFSTLAIIVLSGIAGFVLFNKKWQGPFKFSASAEVTPVEAPGVKSKTKSKSGSKSSGSRLNSVAALPMAIVAVPLLSTNITLIGQLFVTFAGMSLMLFGGGFVFIPLMQETVVEAYGWVSNKEFIDGIALGQVTPGPILISATFIGFKVAGLIGATVATIGIFMPPAIVMLVCTHYMEKLKSSESIRATLKGIRCGVIGMIAAAAYVIILSSELHWATALIFIVALLALLKLKLEVVWIIPVAGITGFLLY
ncbi:MAG: chromate efflux transporter [Gammaproteobacteria bacterium]